jgi:hypothetical protein
VIKNKAKNKLVALVKMILEFICIISCIPVFRLSAKISVAAIF